MINEGWVGIERWFAEIHDYGPDFRLDAERIEAVGANRVIAFLLAKVTGRASGVPISLRLTTVYNLAEGRIRRVRVFQDRAAAIEAAELPE